MSHPDEHPIYGMVIYGIHVFNVVFKDKNNFVFIFTKMVASRT